VVRVGVQSLSASVPPFSQLIRLWDILIAFGPHLNVLSVVGQIHSKRLELLACRTYFKLLSIVLSACCSCFSLFCMDMFLQTFCWVLDSTKIYHITHTALPPHTHRTQISTDARALSQSSRHTCVTRSEKMPWYMVWFSPQKRSHPKENKMR
jgi:hypothetical protein